MRRANVTLRVTTPLFMGGAQSDLPELRAASFKGLLRFWFRALQPGHPEDEARIFGSTSDIRGPSGERGPSGGMEGPGQSLFLLRVKDVSVREVRAPSGGQAWNGSGLSYLGYGVTEGAGRNACRPTRGYFAPGSTFRLEFIFHKRATPDDIRWVLRSLWAFCFFGGAGSRSRRGFGSLELESLEVTDIDAEKDFIPTGIQTGQELARALSARISEWCALPASVDHTAFCHGTRIVVAQPWQSWEQALAYVGGEMLNYRSYRREGNFPEDHDTVRDFLTGNGTVQAPRRVVFGLPHNYYFTSLPRERRNASIAAVSRDRAPIDRRASPLFIHIHPIGKGQGRRYVPVLTFFPAKFLPDGARIRISDTNRGRGRAVSVPVPGGTQGDYAPVEAFLGRFEHHGGTGVRL